MDALLIGAVMFASVVPVSVPANTPVRFTGTKTAPVNGRLVTQSDRLSTFDDGTGGVLTVPRPGSTLRGRLVSVDHDVMNVLLDDQQLARVPLSSVRDLRVSRGRVRSWDRGFLIGMGAGALGGLALASGVCDGVYFKCSAAEGAAFYGAAGAVIGTGIGMLVQREKWERVEPGSFKVAVQPVRSGVGVTLAFALPRR